MLSKMQVPELKCMEPENYRKYFRSLCWSGTRKSDKKPNKKVGKKENLRRLKATSALTVCYAPMLLQNPSQFTVYAAVRKSILSRWRHLQTPTIEISDDSDIDDDDLIPFTKLPKITGIGLRTVFALISEARHADAAFCEHALKALLDVLQGHAPEELSQEPTEVISNLHTMLIDVSGGGPNSRLDPPTNMTAQSSACLLALSVARGEAELILNAVASLVMSSTALSEQNIPIPTNLITLQRSVQSVILGVPSRNQWINFGIPHQSLVTSFPVDLPTQLTSGTGDLVVRSLVSDGCFLYIFTSKGLLKLGSGYGSSIKQHIYVYKPDFFASDRHGWLGYCKNKLYVRIGRKKTEVFEVDKDSLEVKNVLKLDAGLPTPAEPKSAVFTDGNQLGLILLTNYDSLTIRLFDVDSPGERREGTTSLSVRKELNVHLLRRRTLALGKAPFEEVLGRRSIELDAPVAMQLEDSEDDPLMSISAGQDFALLTTASGRIYYTGKTSSLGYKSATTHTSRWILMKESVFTRNEMPNQKKCKVIQVTVGHEGLHAILVLDNGTALFAGSSRRGEDGDTNKHRRAPKPTRPKKIFKAEGHHIVYAACNYGSTALVTKQGLLLMFGKDTQHCDSSGLVVGLKHERIIQVALGKAHAVALTSFGQVYTFGINNKGQCGREFGTTRDKPYQRRRSSLNKEDPRLCIEPHSWVLDLSRKCILCSPTCGNHADESDSEDKELCEVCNVCRRCANASSARAEQSENDDDGDISCKSDREASAAEGSSCGAGAGGPASEGEWSVKAHSLAPGRVPVPGGHRICAVAAGLHHTALLMHNGEILTFGSNQWGQLGAGDTATHQRIVRVRCPRGSSIACGSNHTAVLTREGEVYTFGCYQKGSLGRPRGEDPPRSERAPAWFAAPGRVPRLGPRHACRAVWISASGDQTFVQVSQALIKTDTLFSSTITSNANSIVILPNRPEHTFKCITICKSDGTCNAWTGPEQVDFVNSLACLDPLYDVLWCYQPQMRVMKCYNILAYDSHKINKCCNADAGSYANEDVEFEYPNHGIMKRLEEFKNLENFEVVCDKDEPPKENMALSNMSILNQELAIPAVNGCCVTRMHAALHLLGCLDSLTFAHDNKLNICESKVESVSPATSPAKEDLLTVNRFESHGGGWGYSGHSVEAVRFMCDTDIMLCGFGLFGGRGDYTARIKLFDIGPDGGDQEGDGDLLAETEEVVYECAPRDRFPMLFDSPVPIVANRWYVAWACINGPSSDCGSSGQAMVIHEEVGFHFKTSKKSNNGTDVNAGQIPSLLYNMMTTDHNLPTRYIDHGEPIVVLTKNLSRKVTVNCFKSLIALLNWSWRTFKENILETNGQMPINYHKLTMMKHQKRLVYVIRACLRLTKSYINEIYPQNNRKRNSQEYNSYSEAIGEVRTLIQTIMSDPTPSCSMIQRKPGKNKAHRVCYVQFALELTNSVLKEAHETITSCFHAFFPTPASKWTHLCSLLYNVEDGIVPPSQIRALTSTAVAIATARCLREILQYAPAQSPRDTAHCSNSNVKMIKDVPSRSATVPRSSHAQKPPPVPPRANREQKSSDPQTARCSRADWHLLDVVPMLLDIVLSPLKASMTSLRQCAAPHDHGEMKQQDDLAESCSKLCARIVHDLFHTPNNIKEDVDTNTVKHLITPSRFMRVNQSRVWNTGNGSPDAICFTVDRAGIMLVGACVFGGLGNSEYTLELLHDVRQLRDANGIETEPSQSWTSVDSVHGVYAGVDCQHDMAQIKFNKPIPLKEEVRYAIRLCNDGGRTANGDCGLPSVKGPDGTTFKFSSCSLSFNGTTLARGQIPCLIYYGTARSFLNTSESSELASSLKAASLQVAAVIMERCSALLCNIRNDVPPEELRRNAAVLQRSSAINTLLPFTLASLDSVEDTKGVIKLLELIHKLVTHVAALNLVLPAADDVTTTTAHYYTWVQSDHPYKQTTVSNIRVLFPSCVSWVVLEMDPRSITAQPEDSLTVFATAGVPKHKPCQCYTDAKATDPPFRKRFVTLSSSCSQVQEVGDDSEGEEPCAHYSCTYISVTPKMANVASEWPQKALLVPGNEVIFSLETASDYLGEYNKPNGEESRYGYRCLCVGYEEAAFTSQRQGLVALEMELVHAGAACAARLLAPDLDMPPASLATLVDVQMLAMLGSSPSEDVQQDASEALLLSRGLELSSPPSIHQVLDGQPLLRSVSTERQFLSDLVAGAASTAGGRLARWLAPSPRVEPARCELRPPAAPARPGVQLALPVVVRDQYGDVVLSPALKVEVLIQQLVASAASMEARCGNLPDARYLPTIRDAMCFHSVTMMKAYQSYSFEELRYYSGIWGEAATASMSPCGRVPAERICVQMQRDGSYIATWTPKAAGSYVFRCTLDDLPVQQEITVEVGDALEVGSERGAQGGPLQTSAPARTRRFPGAGSAGLRVRASPSLQAEELGRVPCGSTVGFLEEITNKDGTWVRLSADSVRSFTDGCAPVAWCMQYHRHLDRTLLVPFDNRTALQCDATWPGYGEGKSEMPCNRDDDSDPSNNEMSVDDRRFPFSIQIDMANESDGGGSSPFVFAAEPSKRSRFARNEAAASPPKMQRRSNGNSGEWCSPIRHRSTDEGKQKDVIQETEMEPETEPRSATHLAQAGTQTSPDNPDEAVSVAVAVATSTDGRQSPRSWVRSRVGRPSRPFSKRAISPPPPVPARSSVIKKQAISPAQAECLRAIFAALLWHEGIVHDAIACAAFLKFHPSLPKQGARVVTRPPPRDPPPAAAHRHSVEVATAGQYLRIQASTLEALTKSGMEASASRARKIDVTPSIHEEHDAAETPSVVNVLPPALRALVALWDTLSGAHQLAVATERNKRRAENNENESSSVPRAKPDWRTDAGKQTYSVLCELCGNINVTPPVAAHMRNVHIGCREMASQGYDRVGNYVNVPAPPRHCGQLAQAPFQLWYMFCEQCREKCIASVSPVQITKNKQALTKPDKEEDDYIDHTVIKDNAVFLLDLAPLTNSESGACRWERGPRSPPAPPGSMWQPAPPFQVLAALGAAPRPAPAPPTYHSLRRPQPTTYEDSVEGASGWGASGSGGRVPRSVSMGQGGAELARAVPPREPYIESESLPGAGSSLLSQPSAALQKLVNCSQWTEVCSASDFEQPHIDTEALIKSPVMNFILAKRDLHAFRQKMDAAVRINTVRQFAFEALNWLLRSATQPTCVHDVMWWFCTALDKYSRMVPSAQQQDNKEAGECGGGGAGGRRAACTSALCPGGRAARGARAALHALLGSLGALAPALPPASPALLQAVRCWALRYCALDRAFLHRSQVFSVISKILSHSEDAAYEENAVGTLHDSFNSYLAKENYIWSCPDITSWCDVTVSSRHGMAGALTDNTTETFWESGDEDRNKAKWIQVTYPGGPPEDKPYILCIHIDNTRDTMNKTVLLTFLYSGGGGELYHMLDQAVDLKSASWICYTLPRSSGGPMRVRAELRGPEGAVRVRQLRVLAAPAPLAADRAATLHHTVEADTLRVFRLLTSQVFGKLLEWQRSDGEGGSDGADGAADGAADGQPDDSDLREHVVGILFAGHKLTSLQRQVMSHIVTAIGCEAGRARDDWETALLCAECVERDSECGRPARAQDNYCFEMMCLLLALSGSSVGRAHLAQRAELLPDLLTLLHTGSERVQRQVISLLRRMIIEIPPPKMLAALNYGQESNNRVTLLDHLAVYLAKAITIQVKVKGGGGGASAGLSMGAAVTPVPPNTWFMRGETTKKHADLVAKLLLDMAESKVSPAWAAETVSGLTAYIAAVSQLGEADRAADRCLCHAAVWTCLAALCVCTPAHVQEMNRREGASRESAATLCRNHDDGATAAVLQCGACGPLCADCDRFLHLSRNARSHRRQICKEEESAIRVDIHEGCGRAKLFWLLLLVDRRTLKGLAEFRLLEPGLLEAGAGSEAGAGAGAGAVAPLAGVCRFCGARGNTGLLAIGNVCADQQCQELCREACSRVLECGHACGGVRGERACLPCLHACAGAATLRQDADDMCMICFTDPLQAAPAIQLSCGHVFHLHCCKKVLANKWNGPRITFSFSQCPICKEDMNHWTLEELLAPIRKLREEVRKKALMRLEYEGLAPDEHSSKPAGDLATYAMERYAYYVCHKCEKAYFGGLARCEADSAGAWRSCELVCGACSDVQRARTCPKHAADFLEYKCRYCCSVAVFFCFGTSHFCNACHDDFQRVTNIPKHLLPQCPAGPKAIQLPGGPEQCPLHVQHPPTGEEFALGCGVCRHAHAF